MLANSQVCKDVKKNQCVGCSAFFPPTEEHTAVFCSYRHENDYELGYIVDAGRFLGWLKYPPPLLVLDYSIKDGSSFSIYRIHFVSWIPIVT
mmetsp:Transcript_6048/g.22876  ORF Transcript_6048/g.22876 Transcript_6048/m.22876 type:complete len:92 (-) Transcript_6048:443-718(-)